MNIKANLKTAALQKMMSKIILWQKVSFVQVGSYSAVTQCGTSPNPHSNVKEHGDGPWQSWTQVTHLP